MQGSIDVTKVRANLLSTSPVNSPNKIITAKGDSAASHHYWKQVDCGILTNFSKSPGPTVSQPDNTPLQCTGQGHLPLSSALTPAGTHALILPALKSPSLISLGQLCDNNCEVHLTKDCLKTIKMEKSSFKVTETSKMAYGTSPSKRPPNYFQSHDSTKSTIRPTTLPTFRALVHAA